MVALAQPQTPIKSRGNIALAYARQGFRVFPLHSIHDGKCSCLCICQSPQYVIIGKGTKSRKVCRLCKKNAGCDSPGKHPRTEHGVDDATTDESIIREWWRRWPDANIGIATGEGLYVIDVDLHKGAKLSDLGDIPETLTVKTGGGGYQFYLTTDQTLGNTANKLGQWIDTRGNGGYVVAPGSNHISGNDYEWENDAPSAPLPAHLLEKLKSKKVARPTTLDPTARTPLHASFGDSAYGLKALDDHCRELAAMAPDSGRNTYFNYSAYKMGELIGGGALTRSTVERELTDAALRSGLDIPEIEKLLREDGAIAAGMLHPRSAPPLENTVPYNPTHEEHVTSGNGNGHDLEDMTPEQAKAHIVQLRKEKADLEQQNRLKDEVIRGVKAHVYSKWEKDSTSRVGIAMLLTSFDRIERDLQKSLYDAFPVVMSSGKNAKGEKYTGLAEKLNIDRTVMSKAFHAFDQVGQIRQCERYDELTKITHYDYIIQPEFISNTNPVADKKPYTPRKPREAKKEIEKTVDVTHACLECGTPNLDIICRDYGHVTQLGELPVDETPEVPEATEVPTQETESEPCRNFQHYHRGLSKSVENFDMVPPEQSQVDNTSETIGDLLAARQEASASRTPEESAAIEERNQREWNAMQSAKDRAEQHQQESLATMLGAIKGEPCSTCGCTLYRDMAGDLSCCQCYPARGWPAGARAKLRELFPRKVQIRPAWERHVGVQA